MSVIYSKYVIRIILNIFGGIRVKMVLGRNASWIWIGEKKKSQCLHRTTETRWRNPVTTAWIHWTRWRYSIRSRPPTSEVSPNNNISRTRTIYYYYYVMYLCYDIIYIYISILYCLYRMHHVRNNNNNDNNNNGCQWPTLKTYALKFAVWYTYCIIMHHERIHIPFDRPVVFHWSAPESGPIISAINIINV